MKRNGVNIIPQSIEQMPGTESQNVVPPAANCQLGYSLLQKWNIPDIYCRIARDHNTEDISSGDLPLIIVRPANNSSRKLGPGLDPKPSLTMEATREAQLLGLGEVLLAELESMLQEHLFIAA